MKETLKDFLYWWLSKLEKQKVERVVVGYEMGVQLSRVIPKNGKWYHVALSVEGWFKFNKGEKDAMTIDSVAIYRDGKKVRKNGIAKYKFENLK